MSICLSVPSCGTQKAHLPCIMGGKCVQGNVIYQGAVTRKDTGETNFYTGHTEPSWKLRYGNHKQNFKVDTPSNRTATCLAKHIWMLKDKNVDYSLKFKQLAQASAFNPLLPECADCASQKSFSSCSSQMEPTSIKDWNFIQRVNTKRNNFVENYYSTFFITFKQLMQFETNLD